MNKSNRIKLLVAALLIIVVAVATISYGNSQRKKTAQNDPTQSSLPTIQESQKNNNNPSKPGESQPPPAQSVAPQSQTPPVNQSTPSTGGSSVQPQVPQGRTPATGPVENSFGVVGLGVFTGLYIASRRRLKIVKKAFGK